MESSAPARWAEFKSLIESRNGRIFTSSREYLRDMANPSHLNFNKEVLERLLPSAMSFTNLKSFDDFCRQFVLPAESVPVEDVTSSFRNFESYERELRDLRAQLDRLLRIRELAKGLKDAERDRDVASYLAAEHAWEHAAADVASMESRLAKLREDFAEDEARLKELSEITDETRKQRERSIALLNESTEGRLYKDLADRIRKLEIDIERLRDLSSKINGGLTQRLKAARKWMQEVGKAPVHPFVDVSRMDEALRFLDSCERSETSNSLAHLAQAADQLCKQLRDRFRNDGEELRRLRSEKSDLDAQVDALKRGLPPVSQPLLTALREHLPLLPGEAPPMTLRELCEVEDEAWRAAAEIALQEKFAVFVSPQHHARAVEILTGLPASDLIKAGPQRLIQSENIQTSGKRAKNSLAEIFRCLDPAAERLIESLFGQMVRVSAPEEFARHDSAILPDGLMKRGSTIIRPEPYDGQPFIGEGGLKRQLEIKLARLGEIDAALRRLEPIEREVERLIHARQQEIPDHSDISRELVRVEELPNKQAEHEDLMSQLQAIATDEFSSLEERIDEFKEQIDAWEREKNTILRKGGHKDIEQAEKQLTGRLEEASRREDEFSRVKLRIEISAHRARYVEWKQEAADFTPALDVRAREFSKAAAAAEVTAANMIGDLKVGMLDFKKTFQPKFDDLPEDGRDVLPYERVLGLIEDANIPEYEKKSATERKRWESLFRTQVLSRMQQAIKNVENIISLLNHQLKRPIGHDRYKIERKLNPEFRIYRELIDLNALHHEDELFFREHGRGFERRVEGFSNNAGEEREQPGCGATFGLPPVF